MDWDKTYDRTLEILKTISQFKNQMNFNFHFGNSVYNPEPSSESEERIAELVIKKLKSREAYLDSLSERERNQTVVNSTMATMLEYDILKKDEGST
jgi:hypothetical protein